MHTDNQLRVVYYTHPACPDSWAMRDVFNDDIHCRWSPKGNFIGFNSLHTGSRHVYVMKVKE